VSHYLSQRKFRVSIEGKMLTPRDIQAEVPQGSILFSTLYSMYINDTPRIPYVYLGLFADDTCVYATDRKEVYVLRKLQRVFSAVETWCERWNTKINEDKPRAVYFSHKLRSPEAHLTLNGQNIPFVNYVRYLDVIFNKRH
jgi:hypothetical protein